MQRLSGFSLYTGAALAANFQQAGILWPRSVTSNASLLASMFFLVPCPCF
jgi:hypothetical protein